MEKNILIIGAARTGKTTLAKMIAKEYGYSIISIDDLVSGFEKIPSVNIKHDSDETVTAKNIAPFLIGLLVELSEGTKFYDGIKYVIEGTHIDFEELMPFLQSAKYQEKYDIIGLTYNDITEEELYKGIKEHDTEDDWTYWSKDEDLKGDVRYFLGRNKYFNNKFKEYNIKTYDVSHDRTQVLEEIVSSLDSEKKTR